MKHIMPNMYMHNLEEACKKDIDKILVGQETLCNYYEDIVVKGIVPDLLGKAVQVTQHQFPQIRDTIERFSEILQISPPEAFVVESLYYDVNAEGLKSNWLQLSAKTVFDFPKEELDFLIARQLIHIQCGHPYYEVMMEQTQHAFDFAKRTPAAILNAVFALDAAQRTFSFIMAKWSRISEFSADAGAFLLVNKNISSCVSAILATVFNNRQLAAQVSIEEYIKQAGKINSRDDVMSKIAKLDEIVPYGPFRIQELFRFASSPRSKIVFSTISPSHP